MKNRLLLFFLCITSVLFSQGKKAWNNRSNTQIDGLSKVQLSLGLNAGVPFLYNLEIEAIPPIYGSSIGFYGQYGYYRFKLNQTGINLDGNKINVSGVIDTQLPFVSTIINQIVNAFVEEVFASTSAEINYSEFGMRYYLKRGKGRFYGSLGVAFFNTNFTFSDVPVISVLGEMITQEIPINENLTFPQFKIGFRTKKKFYVKAEAGIMLSNLPSQLNYSNNIDFVLFNISYDHNINLPKIPRISEGVILSFGLGTGYRF